MQREVIALWNGAEALMMIDVISVRRLGGFKLELEFSDGTVGVRDFGSILQKSGPMVEPLKDPAYFARVFIEDGALTWPNGYDWDPIALHDEMKAAGLLRQSDAAVALGGDVLAEGAHSFAGDDLAADRGLDRNLEHVGRDQLFQLLHHGAAAAFGAGAMYQHGKRIDGLAVDQDLHLDQVGGLVVGEVVVERGVALRNRFEAIVEVEHHLVEGQVVFDHGAAAHIGEFHLVAAAVLAQLEHAAEIFVGGQDGGADPGLVDFLDLDHIRHVDRIVNFDLLPVGQRHPVDDRRRRGDQVEVEFALQPLLDDFEVQQPEKAAAEAEAERRARLHLVGEARVVEAQLTHGGAQILKLRRIDREQAAKHHRNRRAETRQGGRGRLAVIRDGVADAGVRHLLDGSGEKSDLARPEFRGLQQFRREHANAVDLVARLGAYHADALAFLECAVNDPHQHHDAEIEVVPAIHQQRLERRVAVPLRRRQAGDDRLQHGLDVEAGFC